MNNQAAQTMPETGSWIAADDVYRHARTIDVALNGEAGAASRPALCDVVSQIATLARQHGPLAAALSQTAGVAEGKVIVPLFPTPEMDAAGKAALSDNGVDNVEDSDALVCYAAMVRAAPAASGGDISHVTIDFPQVGTAGPFKVIDGRMTLPDVTMNDLIHHARMGYVPASNPPSAASVSERIAEVIEQARKFVASDKVPESTRDQVIDMIQNGIEQALTQQRGEPAAWLIRDERGRVVDAVESEAQRDRLLNTGYGQLPQWTAEPLYAGSAPLASAGTSWTHEDLKDLRERLVSAGISAHLNGDSNKASDRQFIRQAVTEAYGLIDDLLTTTPQPSADAVRELIAKWRHEASTTIEDDSARELASCADELESLLSGGSHA